jgi:glycosyltransferase involved in cell wall biosynthesis
LIIQDIYSSGLAETDVHGPLSRLMAGVESWTARAADGVAVIHERFAAQVVDHLGVDEQRVDVIRNWTHVPAVAHFDRPAFRRYMGWDDADIVVLHAGAMGVKQGLENVVDAAALADRQGQPVRFVLLGDGGQRALLESRAEGVKRLEFLDHLGSEDFTRALAAADVLLVNERPGVREMAVPSKLTTYFNAAMPVLAATECDSTTAHEIFAASAGVCVPPGRPEALVAGALLIAADHEAAVKMGARGRQYATDTLSMGQALDRYEDWIQRLARRRRA